jgi:hypothetical protein
MNRQVAKVMPNGVADTALQVERRRYSVADKALQKRRSIWDAVSETLHLGRFT